MAERPSPEGKPRKRRFSVDELFVDSRPRAIGVSDLLDAKEIALERISPDPEQPRQTFDADRLEELAQSIRLEGVLQPIVVRYDANGDRYIILHGERRWRAAPLAGLIAIPALIRDVPPERRLVQQLMENIVRDDLNPVDRAVALRTLKQQLGDTSWDNVAATVGIKRSRLFQLLDTQKLPDPVQDDIRSGLLSEKQSRVLQNLHPAFQLALRDSIIERNLSAEAATSLARQLRSLDPPPSEADAIAILTTLEPIAAPPRDISPVSNTDRARELLDTLAATASGDQDQAIRLQQILTSQAVPARAYRKLSEQTATLAGTLASLHAAPSRERQASRELLLALRDTLNALLDAADPTTK